MRLTCRPTRFQDLEACLALVQDSGLSAPVLRGQHLPFLGAIAQSGALISALAEDEGGTLGKKLVGFTAGFFIPDCFAVQIKTGLHRNVTLAALEKWRLGLKPFLSLDDIRKANMEGGLTVLALHFNRIAGDCTPEEQAIVAKRLNDQFRAGHEGYRVKEWLADVEGIKNRHLAFNMGFHPYRVFAEVDPSENPRPATLETDRFLMGFKPGVSPDRPGTLLSSLSLFTPPLFYFRPLEQEVLREALQNATDEEIGPLLGISTWAVKKRWSGIYRRVASVDPGLLEEGEDAESKVRQKRRYLLDYLRFHPEELRPVCGPRRGVKDGCRTGTMN